MADINQQSNSSPTIRWIVILSIFIIVVGSIMYFATGDQKNGSPKKPAYIFGTTPESALVYAPAGLSRELAPVQMPDASGAKLSIRDITRSSSGTLFYVIANGDSGSVLYQKEVDAKPVLLSEYADVISHLTYSEDFGALAYEKRTPGGETRIVTYTLATRTEKDVAAGTEPVFAEGGVKLVFRSGAAIASYDLVNGSTVNTGIEQLAELPLALDDGSKTLSLYNPIANSIDHFELQGGAYANYRSSEPVTEAPSELSYVGGKLIAITAQKPVFIEGLTLYRAISY